jgi:hypothetical protein
MLARIQVLTRPTVDAEQPSTHEAIRNVSQNQSLEPDQARRTYLHIITYVQNSVSLTKLILSQRNLDVSKMCDHQCANNNNSHEESYNVLGDLATKAELSKVYCSELARSIHVDVEHARRLIIMSANMHFPVLHPRRLSFRDRHLTF